LVKNALKSLRRTFRAAAGNRGEAALLLSGKEMAWRVACMPPNTDFRRVGFKVFSQFDEDGIIQYLINKLPIANRTFIEFGVENYEESNTRFLLLNDHWQGMVLDARGADIRYIQRDKIYWQYDLQAKQTWITRENINELLLGASFGEDVGLLSIDIDGNDYWIWEAIHSVRPRILIIEYNSLFGLQPIAVPYQEDFQRTAAHYSNLYYGASLGALDYLASKKGYLLLGSNVLGHNAFFARQDVAQEFRGLSLPEAYVESKFRESRDRAGNLTHLRGEDRLRLIQDMPVVQVETGETGTLKDLWEAPSLVASVPALK
jgi:hypothetical protein